jgi:hypothetical protein
MTQVPNTFTAGAVKRISQAVRRVEGMPEDYSGLANPALRRELGPRLYRMLIVTVSTDHYVCHHWDGADEGTTNLLVAKPHDLQRTPWDGETVNGRTYTYLSDVMRRVEEGGESWIETLEEAEAGQEILACQTVTGVIVSFEPVYWQDTNQAARQWQRKIYDLAACDEACPDHMQVEGDLEAYIGDAVQIDGVWWTVSEWPELVIVTASADECPLPSGSPTSSQSSLISGIPSSQSSPSSGVSSVPSSQTLSSFTSTSPTSSLQSSAVSSAESRPSDAPSSLASSLSPSSGVSSVPSLGSLSSSSGSVQSSEASSRPSELLSSARSSKSSATRSSQTPSSAAVSSPTVSSQTPSSQAPSSEGPVSSPSSRPSDSAAPSSVAPSSPAASSPAASSAQPSAGSSVQPSSEQPSSPAASSPTVSSQPSSVVSSAISSPMSSGASSPSSGVSSGSPAPSSVSSSPAPEEPGECENCDACDETFSYSWNINISGCGVLSNPDGPCAGQVPNTGSGTMSKSGFEQCVWLNDVSGSVPDMRCEVTYFLWRGNASGICGIFADIDVTSGGCPKPGTYDVYHSSCGVLGTITIS